VGLRTNLFSFKIRYLWKYLNGFWCKKSPEELVSSKSDLINHLIL